MRQSRLSVIGLGLTLAISALPVSAHDLGFAGLLAKSNRTDLPPITLSSGKPLADRPYELKSGGYYRIEIIADGTAEIAIGGGEFFRSVWVNEIVINDVEVRPMGVSSVEFDEEGKALLTFIAIVPGTYELRVSGTTGETQAAVFNIR